MGATTAVGDGCRRVAHDLDHLVGVIERALERIRCRPDPPRGFLYGTDLQLEPM